MAFPRANAPFRQCMRLFGPEGRLGLNGLPARSLAPAALVRQPSGRFFGSTRHMLKKRRLAIPTNSPKHRDNIAAAKAAETSSTTTTTTTTTTHDSYEPPAASSSKGPQPDPEDPLNFDAVMAAYTPVDAHFKSQLSGMAHGGRFSPTNLGALPVTVKDPSSSSPDEPHAHTTFPLRELAQVVPRSGRTISLLVHDRDYIKPILSAVQASKEFNQQPQRSPDNDLELLLKVEAERKDDVARRVRETTRGWRERVRQVRSRHEKVLKGWAKTGVVLPDVVKRAEKELQKVQDRKMKEIDQEEANIIRQL